MCSRAYTSFSRSDPSAFQSLERGSTPPGIRRGRENCCAVILDEIVPTEENGEGVSGEAIGGARNRCSMSSADFTAGFTQRARAPCNPGLVADRWIAQHLGLPRIGSGSSQYLGNIAHSSPQLDLGFSRVESFRVKQK